MIKSVFPLPQNKKKVKVVFDDGQTLITFGETLDERGIKEGSEVSFDKLREYAEDGERHLAIKKAAETLAKSLKSEKQLRQFLYEKGFSSKAIECALERMKEYGYADDAKFAAAYVDFHCAKYGRKKLLYELQTAKGVDKDIACSAVYDALSDEDELRKATAFAEVFYRKAANKKNPAEKLYAHLYAKGFENEIIIKAIGAVTEE